MASKLLDLPCVPFLTYIKAETGDSYQQREERENETRVRHWAMVYADDPDYEGKYITAEFMVVTEGMPDFCGGGLMYSPRVDIFAQSNSWHNHFCAPGCLPDDGHEPTTEWTSFDPDTMALSLAKLTGKKEWSRQEIEEYGMLCILKQVCAQMLNHGKRGVIGADYSRGWMTRIWELGLENSGLILPWVQQMVNIKNKMSSSTFRCYDGGTQVANFNARFDDTWYNFNSGNNVHWLCADISGDDRDNGMGRCWNCGTHFNIRDEEECPDCEEYNSWEPDCCDGFRSDTWTVPRAVKQVYEGPEYQRRARRYFWRNG